MADFAFNQKSYDRWLQANFNADGSPKVPNPNTDLIGTNSQPTVSKDAIVCVECGWEDRHITQEYLEKNPWILKEYKCRKCRHQ